MGNPGTVGIGCRRIGQFAEPRIKQAVVLAPASQFDVRLGMAGTNGLASPLIRLLDRVAVKGHLAGAKPDFAVGKHNVIEVAGTRDLAREHLAAVKHDHTLPRRAARVAGRFLPKKYIGPRHSR
ncbi:MAG TPA: hypothetical protein DD670_20330 [Planctomycetaceae bacterium]|nr:hypothetical protein [Planctomycetaceae bacterium]